MNEADGIIFLETGDLPLVYDWAEKSWKREESLAAEIKQENHSGICSVLKRF